MRHPTERSKIKKQIFIGTPNHGSPKAYVALRDGTGLFSTGKIARNFPRDLHILAHDLPGIYQLLPDERYQRFFFDYGTLVRVKALWGATQEERSIRGTYIAGDPSSTIYPNSPNEALAHYALNNNNLVNDSLDFRRNELGRQTFLPDKTYAIYSTELGTINGLEYMSTPGGKGAYRVLPNSDETVPERSVYDLDQLIDPLDNITPNPKYTKRFSNLSHTELQWKRIVLRCVLTLILD